MVNKLLTSHEQVPAVVIMRLKTDKTTIPGCGSYGVGCRRGVPHSGIIRLSQLPAGDWLAGAWAELGNKLFYKLISIICLPNGQGQLLGSAMHTLKNFSIANKINCTWVKPHRLLLFLSCLYG